MNAWPFIRQFLLPLCDFIYPPVCALCDGDLARSDRAVCSLCWNSFAAVGPEHPVWRELGAKLASAGAIDGLFARYLFEKEARLQDALHLLKYGGWKSIGVRLGADLGNALGAQSWSEDIDLLIPVPLHSVKERERGYNQAALICRGIGEVTHLPVSPRLLKRVRYTGSQTKLSAEERRLNVEGAFAVRRGAEVVVRDRSILLVDDVLTTGATVSACVSALRKAGAARVFIAAAALAQ